MPRLLEIPIFPLRTVLYPGGRLPLRIFETRYVDMTKSCIGEDEPFGVCLILEGAEVGAPAVPAMIGCTARISEWDVPAPGLFTLNTIGEQPFRIRERFSTPGGLIRALVQIEDPPPAEMLPLRYRFLRQLLEEIIAKIGVQHFPDPLQLGDAAWVAYRLAEVLPLSSESKLEMLAQRDPAELLALIEKEVRAAS
ncbi:MAG: peptidase [Hydrocarboniphaga sp.]|uniref:LON peptidase substrate-binding domain-containing protein n=1 Tax=Hydrocarboniphaga sp. TaxID=2033016 RepID=UPI00261E6652|nr:LON peptidase substrate-binding domain-containing protein [Hydrocarboniphaga sp.]MDB5967564.1 peptidase [Hydrocarboniphaga sp.]